MRNQEALIDFQPLLVAQYRLGLALDLGAGRRQPRKRVGRREHKLLDTNEAREVMGERRVDRIPMRAKKAHAGEPRAFVDGVRSLRLGRLSRRPLWQAGEQHSGVRPEHGIAPPVLAERRGLRRFSRNPIVDRRRRQADVAERRAQLFMARRRRIHRGHAFGLRSMTRFALPCERSSVSVGGRFRAFVVTPT